MKYIKRTLTKQKGEREKFKMDLFTGDVDWKKMHNLKVENYVLVDGQNWGLKLGRQSLR